MSGDAPNDVASDTHMANDAKPLTDAALDGGADSAPGSHWCDMQTNVLFCADFDEANSVPMLASAWTTSSQVGGLLEVDDTSGPPSAPNAMEVIVSGTTGVQAFLSKTVPLATKPNKLLLAFDLFDYDAFADVGPFASLAMGADVSAGSVGLAFAKNSTSSGSVYQLVVTSPASAGGGSSSLTVNSAIPLGAMWGQRVTLEIDFTDGDAGRTACAQFAVGSVTSGGCFTMPASLADPGEVSVVMGVDTQGSQRTGQGSISFDDVTLSAE
jgi:hypothetical protein